MVTISLLIVLLLILFGIYKILKGIISFLFGSNSNSDKITFSDVMDDDGPSELKYNNEVYISFRNKVQKAYERFKQSGYKIVWDSDIDGFYIFEDKLPSDGTSMYAVEVHYDDQNIFKLNDPFYILVTYGILFEKRYYDKYEEQAEYLNDYLYELKKPGMFYTVDIVEGSNLGIYYCHLVVSNNKNLCEQTEKLGEAEVFRQVMSEAKQFYRDGQEIYNAEVVREAKN